MPRYIDAEAMLKRCKELTDNSTITRAHLIVDASLKWFEAFIKTQPTAIDVIEVKHGKWVEQVKVRKDGEVRLIHWQCSLCGCFLGTNTANYCPNCGAKMVMDDETDERN